MAIDVVDLPTRALMRVRDFTGIDVMALRLGLRAGLRQRASREAAGLLSGAGDGVKIRGWRFACGSARAREARSHRGH